MAGEREHNSALPTFGAFSRGKSYTILCHAAVTTLLLHCRYAAVKV
jgi:hypothetical protein